MGTILFALANNAMSRARLLAPPMSKGAVALRTSKGPRIAKYIYLASPES
ncbi:hypothetical protein Rhe02_79520 [Rhizocola hellebori]|uniref:Uncharacterized protein n=1 Tax=Rhizocola hellebori TaxID=1392758 RepID=A0A8J3QFE2_9ACTN|nr:hypothetical protein Rhe02_79520 [Rhizocola hellebori]